MNSSKDLYFNNSAINIPMHDYTHMECVLSGCQIPKE